jgi:hypothetical protein
MRGIGGPWKPPGQPELFPATDRESRCVGEFSVTWNRALQVWLLLYNCTQGTVVARIARAPWGPWSDATVILSGGQDGSPCRLLMTAGRCGNQENYQDQPGSFYAPFVMERYTTLDSMPPGRRRATIYWLVSTWNPYQVVVMRTTLDVGTTGITDKIKQRSR